MAKLRLDQVHTVYRKEVLEILRDRRTLILMIGVPVLLYPLITLVGVQVTALLQSKIAKKSLPVALLVESPSIEPSWVEQVAAEHKIEWLPLAAESLDDPEAQLGERVRAREFMAALHLQGAAAPSAENSDQVAATLIYDSGEVESTEAKSRVQTALRDLSKELTLARLEHMDRDPALIEPYRVESVNVATAKEKGAFFLGGFLSFLLITMALTGAFYPALDLSAGERERGTLETLLVAPVGRREMILGKYFTVLTVSVVTSLLNIACMGLTFSTLASGVAANLDIEFQISFGILIRMLMILLPLAAFLSAVTLGTSSFARSYKEGQNYLTPLFILVMLPAMLPLLPGIKLNLAFAGLPIAGPALLFRELLLERATFAHALVVFLSTFCYAGLMLAWVSRLFEREEVLFREGDLQAISLQRPTTGHATPDGTAAAALFVVILAFMGYVTLTATADAGIFRSLVAPQLLLYLLIPLGVAFWRRNDLRETFALRLPGWTAWLAVPFLVAGALPLSLWLAQFQSRFLEPDDSIAVLQEFLRTLIETAGPWGTIALVALLPAVCEEIFCRGYLLSGFRKTVRPWAAIAIVAFLFGILHLSVPRLAPTAFLGLLLGLTVLRSRSIGPAILVHLLNNGIVIVASAEFLEVHGDSTPGSLMKSLQETQFASWVATSPNLVVALAPVALVIGFALCRPSRATLDSQ